MSEIATANSGRRPAVSVHWGRAIGAGVIATILITIVGAFLGTNFLKMLGSMIAPRASLAVQYPIGGAMHFTIGILWGVIYAALVGGVVEWNRVVKGVVYGLAIAAIAFAAMPVMSAMRGGGAKMQHAAMNPCHPSSGMSAPSQQAAGGNPCNPGNGGGGSWSGAISVVNHLVYGLALSFAYGKVR